MSGQEEFYGIKIGVDDGDVIRFASEFKSTMSDVEQTVDKVTTDTQTLRDTMSAPVQFLGEDFDRRAGFIDEAARRLTGLYERMMQVINNPSANRTEKIEAMENFGSASQQLRARSVDLQQTHKAAQDLASMITDDFASEFS